MSTQRDENDLNRSNNSLFWILIVLSTTIVILIVGVEPISIYGKIGMLVAFSVAICITVLRLRKLEMKIQSGQEVVKRLQLRYDLAIQGSGAGIYEWNIVTGVITHNRYVDQMLGYKTNELPDMTLEDFISRLHPDDRVAINQSVINHLDHGHPYSVKFRMRCKDDSYIWVSDSGLAMRDATGKPVLWAGTMMNIDEQVRYETNLLFMNEELAKSNSELDLLVYRLSHDLKSPLASILGLTAIGNMSGQLEEMKFCLKSIEERARALDSFVKELVLSIKSSVTGLVVECVDLKSLVEDVVRLHSTHHFSDRMAFVVDLENEFLINTDRLVLISILNNLVGNAVKYSDMEKENPKVVISCVRSDENWTLVIRDNGRGIENEHQSKIFNMFYRATKEQSGSGLGLYIVKESVTKLRGLIVVSSSLGVGTEFRITLPTKYD